VLVGLRAGRQNRHHDDRAVDGAGDPLTVTEEETLQALRDRPLTAAGHKTPASTSAPTIASWAPRTFDWT
jgi:hypothetical protein